MCHLGEACCLCKLFLLPSCSIKAKSGGSRDLYSSSAGTAPVGNRLMDGRRYAYSASSPYLRAVGTTSCSKKKPCQTATQAGSA